MNLDNAKILICDDSLLDRKRIKDIIQPLGNPIILEALDGQSSIDTYKEYVPDIVFLDVVMPNKDGNLVIDELLSYDPKATIIVVSSISMEAQIDCLLKSGAKKYITKPVEANTITSVIHQYLGGN